MKTKRLTNSIIIILLLSVLLVAQHASKFFTEEESYISISINMLMMLTTIAYYLQLHYNFKHYLLIDNIRKQIIIIIITHIITYVFGIIYPLYIKGNITKEMPGQDMVFAFLVMAIGGAAAIIWIIQQIILANKFVRNKNNIEIRRLGYSIYSLFIFFFIVPFLNTSPALKPYIHIKRKVQEFLQFVQLPLQALLRSLFLRLQ